MVREGRSWELGNLPDLAPDPAVFKTDGLQEKKYGQNEESDWESDEESKRANIRRLNNGQLIFTLGSSRVKVQGFTDLQEALNNSRRLRFIDGEMGELLGNVYI